MSRPLGCSHIIAILKYLMKPPRKDLIYEYMENAQIVGYSDTNWTWSLSDKCSTSRYFVLVMG